LHHNKTAWRKLYKEHDVKELAEMVMEDEIEARLSDKKALFIEDTEWSALIMQNIILSTDRILLESILVGDLTKGRSLQHFHLTIQDLQYRGLCEIAATVSGMRHYITEEPLKQMRVAPGCSITSLKDIPNMRDHLQDTILRTL
jgi:hypothetical protein